MRSWLSYGRGSDILIFSDNIRGMEASRKIVPLGRFTCQLFPHDGNMLGLAGTS